MAFNSLSWSSSLIVADLLVYMCALLSGYALINGPNLSHSFQLLHLVQKTTEIAPIFVSCPRERSLLAAVLTGFIFKLMAERAMQVSCKMVLFVFFFACTLIEREGDRWLKGSCKRNVTSRFQNMKQLLGKAQIWTCIRVQETCTCDKLSLPSLLPSLPTSLHSFIYLIIYLFIYFIYFIFSAMPPTRKPPTPTSNVSPVTVSNGSEPLADVKLTPRDDIKPKFGIIFGAVFGAVAVVLIVCIILLVIARRKRSPKLE